MDGKPERDIKGFYNLIAQQYQNMPKERVWNFVNQDRMNVSRKIQLVPFEVSKFALYAYFDTVSRY